MNTPSDPFRHHPELREQIADPLQSFFRTFTIADLERISREKGQTVRWWYPDEEREAMRAETLSGHLDDDLWVFAYGSLMWDPAFRFSEVHRAHAPDYARRFILRDTFGARGTPDQPGLMAALDPGAGCDGLVFRIPEDWIEEETPHIWGRERAGPAYHEAFIAVQKSSGPVTALTFVADHGSDIIVGDISRDEQVTYLATGTGVMGTSLEYIENLSRQFAAIGITDDEVDSLLSGARNRVAALASASR